MTPHQAFGVIYKYTRLLQITPDQHEELKAALKEISNLLPKIDNSGANNGQSEPAEKEGNS